MKLPVRLTSADCRRLRPCQWCERPFKPRPSSKGRFCGLSCANFAQGLRTGHPYLKPQPPVQAVPKAPLARTTIIAGTEYDVVDIYSSYEGNSTLTRIV